MRRHLPLALLLAAAAFAPGAAHSQRAPESRRAAVSVNPLGIPFGWFTGEAERTLGGGASLAVAGSWFEVPSDEDRLATVEAKLRYYPAEQGLRGFALGLTAGYTRFEERFETYPPTVVFGPEGPSERPILRTQVTDGPTVGVTADYNWLLGARRRMLVGIGVGAKRLFTNREDARQFDDYALDLPAYPTARFAVGLTF